jgi:hypothetical protein
MRLRLLVVPILLAAAACGAPTDPSAASVEVEVRNEVGASAGRHRIQIVRAVGGEDTKPLVSATTGTDGRVSVRLESAGAYEVRVVPTEGFASAAPSRRTISVAAGERVAVVFTLHRAHDPGPGEPGW